MPVATRASVPFPRAALLAKLDNESQMLLLSPVDPTTGTALAAYAPIRLGLNFYYRFTPDRKSLIFASYPSTDPSRATLHVVDLASWHDESAIQITSKGWPSALTVSRDGALFAIVIVQPKDSSLWLVDAVKHVVLAHHVMPLLVTSMQFTGDHQGLMLYGRQEDPNTSLSGGPPIAQLLSARGLDMLWSRTLKDVRDGFEPNQTFTGSAHDPGAGTTFRPAVVFAPDTDVMYIVHAGEDKLTRVDFAKKSALTLDVRPAASWFEQLLAFTAGTAYAKAQDGVERSAVISTDGKTIYTCGVQNKWRQGPAGSWELAQTPLSLTAIGVAQAVQLYKSEVAGGEVRLSGDGTRLFVPQVNYSTGFTTGTIEADRVSGGILADHTGLDLRSTRRIDGTSLAVSATRTSASQVAGYSMSALGPDGVPLGTWDEPAYADWLIFP
jgi:hypothetical protein